jgi:hypothetical protein
LNERRNQDREHKGSDSFGGRWLAAESFSANVTKSLVENCDSEETISQLKALAGETEASPKAGMLAEVMNIFKWKN